MERSNEDRIISLWWQISRGKKKECNRRSQGNREGGRWKSRSANGGKGTKGWKGDEIQRTAIERNEQMGGRKKKEKVEEEERHGERDGGASARSWRKYGKRLASFSSIRFELLSSRRALSIVAENYFIIARSVGFECSREIHGTVKWRRRKRRGPVEAVSVREEAKGWCRHGGTTVQLPRSRDLLISRKKTRGPSKNAAAATTTVGENGKISDGSNAALLWLTPFA